MGIENRRHPRWNISLDIRYKSHSSKGFSFGKLLVPPAKATAVNISLGGLSLKTPEKLKQGEHLKLKIDFPSSDAAVSAVAEVLHSKPEGLHHITGVKFLELHTETDDILGEMLTQQLEQIKSLPVEKRDEAKKRIIDRLFMSLIQTEHMEKSKKI